MGVEGSAHAAPPRREFWGGLLEQMFTLAMIREMAPPGKGEIACSRGEKWVEDKLSGKGWILVVLFDVLDELLFLLLSKV
jgi:hypothetical protein